MTFGDEVTRPGLVSRSRISPLRPQELAERVYHGSAVSTARQKPCSNPRGARL
jgi:hypothetical protein